MLILRRLCRIAPLSRRVGEPAGRLGRAALLGAVVAALPAPTTPANAQVPVDLELVLAVDASGSVNNQEFRLQVQGIASAFRDPKVVDAIASGLEGRIAVALVIWGEATDPKDMSRWHIISTAADADAFASLVEHYPRRLRAGATGIGSGIAVAIRMMERSGVAGARRVVDVSGDGPETPPDPMTSHMVTVMEGARRMAQARGVTVNGLAILNDFADLDKWYEREVRTGPGSFVMAADDYEDFARAMLVKLLREIEQGPPISYLEADNPRLEALLIE